MIFAPLSTNLSHACMFACMFSSLGRKFSSDMFLYLRPFDAYRVPCSSARSGLQATLFTDHFQQVYALRISCPLFSSPEISFALSRLRKPIGLQVPWLRPAGDKRTDQFEISVPPATWGTAPNYPISGEGSPEPGAVHQYGGR